MNDAQAQRIYTHFYHMRCKFHKGKSYPLMLSVMIDLWLAVRNAVVSNSSRSWLPVAVRLN